MFNTVAHISGLYTQSHTWQSVSSCDRRYHLDSTAITGVKGGNEAMGKPQSFIPAFENNTRGGFRPS